MAATVYEEWRSGNKYSSYPFSDTSTFKSISGIEALKASLIDASIHIIGGLPPFFIRSIVPLDGTTTAELRISDASVRSKNGFSVTAVIDSQSTDERVALTDVNGRSAGIILMDRDSASSLVTLANSEDLKFRSTALEFVSNVCIPLPDVGFRGFILPDGQIVTGSVVFAGENGIVLSEENDAIRVDIVGDPYYSINCLEAKDIPVANMCGVRTINGIAPDDNGDFKLTTGSYNASDTILRIVPISGGVNILLVPEG